ncbi:MAG: hypothetical protein WEC15_07565 [Flavobacteriales bacterium]
MQFYFDHPWYYVVYAALLVASVAGGFALAHYQFHKKQRDWRPSGIEAAIIGLFGLMLSFTFLAAHNATRERNRMVHEQADAIATMRRNSLLLTEPLKKETRHFLRAHLAIELRMDSARFDGREAVHDRMEGLMGRYLSRLMEHSADSTLTDGVHVLMHDLNAVSSTYYRAYYGYEERIPRLMIDLLLISAMLIGLLVGFMNGMGGVELRQMITSVLFLVIVLLTIRTVLDMNNPYHGTIQPEQENLERLLESLRASDR